MNRVILSAAQIADSLIAESIEKKNTVTCSFSEKILEVLAPLSESAYEFADCAIARGEKDGSYWAIKLVKP